MVVYSFFLDVNKIKDDDFEFLVEYRHCLSNNYKGFHPVIKNPDGTFKLLYAVTTSKRIRDIFKMTRNMKIFTYYKSDMKKSTFNDLKQACCEVFLTEKELIDVDHARKKIHQIPTVLTHYELEKVNDELIMVQDLRKIFGEESYSMIEYRVFTDKLLKLFDKIKFAETLLIIQDNLGANDSDVEFFSADFTTYLNMFYENMTVKTFEVFIDLFGITLNI